MNIEKLLGFNPSTMKYRTEIIGGATTFLTMSYILAVNPDILSATGMDKGALFTSTALAAAVATLLLAFMAKLPFAQAPSMGLNAFFAYTLVLGMGYSWQTALAAMLVEGLIFILITVLNVREKILNSIPENLRYAISVGIGMFIAFIGLKNAGIIVASPGTFVTLGEFTPAAILGIIGILLSGVLVARKVKGALFYGIILCTLIGIPMGVTKIPDGFLPMSMPRDITPIFCKFDFHNFFSFNMVIVILTLLIINIFDTIGALVGLAMKTGVMKEDGTIPHVKEAMLSDAIGTTVGSMLGSSTLTPYIESASGINEGARSGFASLVTGILFLVALFLAPIFMLIPSSATTGALFLVGVSMLESVQKINFRDICESLPAFVTILFMVLTYSISDGVCCGILSYVLLKVLCGKFREVSITLYILAVLFILQYAF